MASLLFRQTSFSNHLIYQHLKYSGLSRHSKCLLSFGSKQQDGRASHPAYCCGEPSLLPQSVIQFEPHKRHYCNRNILKLAERGLWHDRFPPTGYVFSLTFERPLIASWLHDPSCRVLVCLLLAISKQSFFSCWLQYFIPNYHLSHVDCIISSYMNVILEDKNVMFLYIVLAIN